MPTTTNWRTIRERIDPAASPKSAAIFLLQEFGVKQPPIRIEGMILRLEIQLRRNPRSGWIAAIDARKDPPYIWIAKERDAHTQHMAMALELGRLLLYPLHQVYSDLQFSMKGESVRALAFARWRSRSNFSPRSCSLNQSRLALIVHSQISPTCFKCRNGHSRFNSRSSSKHDHL